MDRYLISEAEKQSIRDQIITYIRVTQDVRIKNQLLRTLHSILYFDVKTNKWPSILEEIK